MKIKKAIKHRLRLILLRLDYILDYRYDFRRYRKYSIIRGIPKSKQQLRFRLLQRAHSFEKGLSLPNIRPLFGKEKLKELIYLIRRYQHSGMPMDGVEYRKAIHAYQSYLKFHQKLSVDIHQEFDFLVGFSLKDEVEEGQSIKPVTAKEIIERSQGNFEQLSSSRFSARQFSSEPVDTRLIQEAVLLAQKSPSVCNRQSAQAFLIDNENVKKEALRIQAGNTGFGHEVNKLLVITASLECFDGPKERNQGYIDGGLFAMSVIYALHYKGLAVCPLNWSSGRKKDLRFRGLVDIPESHNIIMLLAIGHHKEQYGVAVSPRRVNEEVFNILT